MLTTREASHAVALAHVCGVFRFPFPLAVGGDPLAVGGGPLPVGGGSVIPYDRYTRLVVDLVSFPESPAPSGKGIAPGGDGPSCSDGDAPACGDDPSRLDTGLVAPGNSGAPQDVLTEIDGVAQCLLTVRPWLHVVSMLKKEVAYGLFCFLQVKLYRARMCVQRSFT